VITGQADYYGGRGREAARSLRYLNPTLSTSSRLTRELVLDDELFERFIVDTSKAVQTIASRRDDLSQAVSNANTTAAVDLIISAHTHVPYDCVLDDPAGAPRPVTQAGFYGKAITDIRMEINSTSGEVDRATITADNIPVTRDVPADPDIQRIVDYWLAQSAGPRAVVLGTQSADLDRAYLDGSSVRSAESGFGNLIADAQLAALAGDPTYGNVVAAFMNPGGIRADINCADTPSGEPVGTITFGEAFTAQPFSNTVNAVRLSGTAIDQILEQQWRVVNGAEQFLALSVSATLQYSYDPRLPLGERIAPGAITINGVPVDPAGEYDVVANSFLTSGGDGFAAFTTGTTPITGPNDVDALAAYIAENSPVAPPALGRAISLDPARPQVDDGSGTGPCDLPVAPPGPVPPGPVAPGPVAPGAGPPGKPGPVALPAPGLPATGVPTGELSVLAGLLLLSGAGACVVGRPRRRGAVLTD
jgi:5'-nucleotidase